MKAGDKGVKVGEKGAKAVKAGEVQSVVRCEGMLVIRCKR